MFDDVGVGEIGEIAACDRLIRAAQARQAAIIARLYDKRLELGHTRPAFRIEAGKVAQSVIAEVAMVRQISASGAASQFGFALGLRSLPAASRLFAEGVISERVAKAVVAEVGGLAREDAAAVDRGVAAGLGDMTARRAGAAARKLVLSIDPHGAQHAANVARSERYISIHVLPHSMATISMRLPAEQAAVVYKALDNIAQGLKYEGDPRSASHIMVDTAVERITGQKRANDIAVEIGLLDGPLAGFVRERDQQCSRPYCDCRIRDIDHPEPFNGFNTTADNAQGLCKRSHTTKHLPGWRVDATVAGTTWTTPTGHTYTSRRPDLHGYGPKMSLPKTLDDESAMERHLGKFLAKPSLHRRQ